MLDTPDLFEDQPDVQSLELLEMERSKRDQRTIINIKWNIGIVYLHKVWDPRVPLN